MSDSVKRPYLSRTSFRLSLQFVALYSVLSLVVFVGAYVFTLYEMKDWAKDKMEDEVRQLKHQYKQGGLDALSKQIGALSVAGGEGQFLVGLFDAQGNYVVSNFSTKTPLASRTYILASDIILLQVLEEDDEKHLKYWLHVERVDGHLIVLGTSNEVVGEFVEALVIALSVGLAFVTLGGLLFGISIGRLTESRINEISEILNAAAHGDLNRRIVTSGEGNDDLGLVNIKINTALDRIQKLVATQKQITTDIAHDLRSPLQRLKQRLHKIETSKGTQIERDNALKEIDNLVDITHSLLLIANLNEKKDRQNFQTTAIYEILETLVEVYDDAAIEKGQSLTLVPSNTDITVFSDPMLLRQMVANLIENAIRHCPDAASIEVGVRNGSKQTIIYVSDNGPGIPLDKQQQVMQRFVRLDTARNTVGNGLGLSIVGAVSQYLGARVAMSDNNSGLRVEIVFAS